TARVRTVKSICILCYYIILGLKFSCTIICRIPSPCRSTNEWCQFVPTLSSRFLRDVLLPRFPLHSAYLFVFQLDKIFRDPLERGFLLKSVSLSLSGCYLCSLHTNSSLVSI